MKILALFLSTSIVFTAFSALAVMPGESKELLLSRTGNAKATTRSDAANILSSYTDPRVNGRLIEMTQDPDWRVRYDAVKSLGRLNDTLAAPYLLPLVKDPMPHVRMISIWALYQMGDLEAIPSIIEAVEDANSQVSQMAQMALKNFSQTRENRSETAWKMWWQENQELIASSGALE